VKEVIVIESFIFLGSLGTSSISPPSLVCGSSFPKPIWGCPKQYHDTNDPGVQLAGLPGLSPLRGRPRLRQKPPAGALQGPAGDCVCSTALGVCPTGCIYVEVQWDWVAAMLMVRIRSAAVLMASTREEVLEIHHFPLVH